jgi:hypothetical protein
LGVGGKDGDRCRDRVCDNQECRHPVPVKGVLPRGIIAALSTGA